MSRWSDFDRLLADGWQLSGVLHWQNGLYLTPTTGDLTDRSSTALTLRAIERPGDIGTN